MTKKIPLIVVKRPFFDEFEAGRKTIEYRRYGRQFTERTFYPGRAVRISWSYNIKLRPFLDAVVILFERKLKREIDVSLPVYVGLPPCQPMALIHLEIIKRDRDVR